MPIDLSGRDSFLMLMKKVSAGILPWQKNVSSM
jgi:hypothetical protein